MHPTDFEKSFGIVETKDDPHVGKTIVHNGKRGRLVCRSGAAYKVEWLSGPSCGQMTSVGVRLVESALAKLAGPAASKEGAGSRDVAALIREQAIARNAGTLDINQRAREILQEMDDVRAGKPPKPLTQAERDKILSRVMHGPRLPMTDAERAKIQSILDSRPGQRAETESYADAVSRNVAAIIKAKRGQ